MSPQTRPSGPLRLDPRNLKGLAHPLRVRLLGSLREQGPGTASMLAARLGESSGATSYHLRQLEAFGFIEEDPTRGTARERWWRAAHACTWFDEATLRQGGEQALLGAEYLRAVAQGHMTRMEQWIDHLPRAMAPWAAAGTLSDWLVRLTPDQAREVLAEITRLVARFPAFEPEHPPESGSAPVAIQIQILPRLSPD